MKNIKYLAILLFQFSLVQLSFAQATEDNGRAPGTVAGTPAVEEVTTTNNNAAATTNSGTYSDQDVPGVPARPESADAPDIHFPSDFEEIMASSNSQAVAQRVNELTSLIDDMRQVCEELRLENKVIRESLSNCCSNSALGLSASDAYLLQNAPNPFSESAEIRYFVPGGLEDVEIRVADIKGETLKTIKIEEAGYGKFELRGDTFNSGSFIYMLAVKGEIIDSKVMIITQ